MLKNEEGKRSLPALPFALPGVFSVGNPKEFPVGIYAGLVVPKDQCSMVNNQCPMINEKQLAASNNVIPAKAGIQKLLKSLDSQMSLPRA